MPVENVLTLRPGDVAQAHLLERLGGARARQPVERAEQLEVLARGRALVEVRRLADEVDLAAHGLELARDVVAEHPRLARSSASRGR